LHFHTIGDASLRQILDAMESCRHTDQLPKLTLAHRQLAADSDQARLARLKPLITCTGIWCIRYQAVEQAIGTQRYLKMYRLGRLQRDHGLNVALGSDWPATYAGASRHRRCWRPWARPSGPAPRNHCRRLRTP
jgi:predicted amidohydrolase YtcJ